LVPVDDPKSYRVKLLHEFGEGVILLLTDHLLVQSGEVGDRIDE
jgi:hypothetical protein